MYSQNVKPSMSLGESLSTVFSKYAVFTGRARRSEFWWFTICYYAIQVAFNIASLVMMVKAMSGEISYNDSSYSLFLLASVIIGLGLLLPSLAVTVRRFHDIGKSGWNLLWAAIPLVGLIIVLVWMCQDSDVTENQYGPSPKYITEEYTITEKPKSDSNTVWGWVAGIAIAIVIGFVINSNHENSNINSSSSNESNYPIFNQQNLTSSPSSIQTENVVEKKESDLVSLIANKVGKYPYEVGLTDNKEFSKRFSSLIGSKNYSSFKTNRLAESPIEVYDDSEKYLVSFWDKDEWCQYYIIYDKLKDNLTVIIQGNDVDSYAQEKSDKQLIETFSR